MIDFNPVRHPRDRHGRFLDVLQHMGRGAEARFPDGIRVRRESAGFHVVLPERDREGRRRILIRPSAREAATAAFEASARSTHPLSIGGPVAYRDESAANMHGLLERKPASLLRPGDVVRLGTHDADGEDRGQREFRVAHVAHDQVGVQLVVHDPDGQGQERKTLSPDDQVHVVSSLPAAPQNKYDDEYKRLTRALRVAPRGSPEAARIRARMQTIFPRQAPVEMVPDFWQNVYATVRGGGSALPAGAASPGWQDWPTHVDRRPTEVIDAEDAFNALHNKFFGAGYTDRSGQWGEPQERHAEKLAADLRALYRKHAIPDDQRLAGFGGGLPGAPMSPGDNPLRGVDRLPPADDRSQRARVIRSLAAGVPNRVLHHRDRVAAGPVGVGRLPSAPESPGGGTYDPRNDPNGHPMALVRTRIAVNRMLKQPGDSVTLPGGVRIVIGQRVNSRIHGSYAERPWRIHLPDGSHVDPVNHAVGLEMALQASAASTHPDSIGGTKSLGHWAEAFLTDEQRRVIGERGGLTGWSGSKPVVGARGHYERVDGDGHTQWESPANVKPQSGLPGGAASPPRQATGRLRVLAGRLSQLQGSLNRVESVLARGDYTHPEDVARFTEHRDGLAKSVAAARQALLDAGGVLLPDAPQSPSVRTSSEPFYNQRQGKWTVIHRQGLIVDHEHFDSEAAARAAVGLPGGDPTVRSSRGVVGPARPRPRAAASR